MPNKKLVQSIKLVLMQRGVHGKFGRTKLMKYLYFLQEQAGVDVGVEFELYTWGPFSKDVMFVLGEMSHGDQPVVKQTPLPEGEGYDLSLIDEADEPKLTAKASELFAKLQSKNSKDLEALSTIHLIRKRNAGLEKQKVVDWVKSLKPYFLKKELAEYYDELDRIELAPRF